MQKYEKSPTEYGCRFRIDGFWIFWIFWIGTGRDLSVHYPENHHPENHSEINHPEINHPEINHSDENYSDKNHSGNHHSENYSEINHLDKKYSDENHSGNHHPKNYSEINHSGNHYPEINHSNENYSDKNHPDKIYSDENHSKNHHFDKNHSEQHSSGKIIMQLNPFGVIVKNQIEWLMCQYPYVEIHNYVIMPNHFHLILEIDSSRVATDAVKNKSLSSLMGALKTTTSKQIHELGFEGFSWHRSFHDHIIRNEKEYNLISNYIDLNPQKWFQDKFYNKV